MSFGQRRDSSADDVPPPPRARPGSLSSRASGVGAVVGTSKNVQVQNTTAAAGGAAKENAHAKKAAFGSSAATAAAAASGKENAARNVRPSSARPAARVSVERAPLQVFNETDFVFLLPPIICFLSFPSRGADFRIPPRTNVQGANANRSRPSSAAPSRRPNSQTSVAVTSPVAARAKAALQGGSKASAAAAAGGGLTHFAKNNIATGAAGGAGPAPSPWLPAEDLESPAASYSFEDIVVGEKGNVALADDAAEMSSEAGAVGLCTS
jgi:hypothetical protein